jgi:hypothetical protein
VLKDFMKSSMVQLLKSTIVAYGRTKVHIDSLGLTSSELTHLKTQSSNFNYVRAKTAESPHPHQSDPNDFETV